MDVMTKAKTRLLLNHPFFAILLMKQKVVEDVKTKTASVDGKYLRYNPQWFESLDSQEQIFLLAHEVLHLALSHHTRRNHRNPRKWNEACDYAINMILKDSGLKMPKGGLWSAKYRGLSAEEIYDLLPDGNSPEWNPGDGFDGSWGDVMDFPDVDESASETLQQQSNLIEAMNIVEGRGIVPEAIKRIIEEIQHPTIAWYEVLERLRSQRSRDDYSYARGHRSYMARGLFMPVLQNQTYDSVVIAIDTSGSITQEMLTRMASESKFVSDILNNTLHVIYVDERVRKVEVFEADDDLELKMYGGGGTDFRPPFRYVEENDLQPKLLLYFTDGHCSKFPIEPEYDVVWLCTRVQKTFEPPFGEVIYF